ncbi:hypothetical protein PMIN01_08646 [Paraphaeosphaeria minitans]|uniref:Uncharacterized protein n=1 Tax=Paraphaeosphaeria minitans TaxID=565426 RepID=A0A9P6GF14_9PLEO|nr:hypothetical protein PMIN01_08646 [Paraphaeosphaeria minitans]
MARYGRIPTVQANLPLLKPAARCTLLVLHSPFSILQPFSSARSCPSASSTHSLSTVVVASALPVYSATQIQLIA